MEIIKRLAIFLFVIIGLFIANQCSHTSAMSSSDVEKIDRYLVGKKIGDAIRILHLDTNWSVIHEPPGIMRGIWVLDNDTCKIQLIVERTVSVSRDRYSRENLFKAIKNKKIIGISWEKKNKCRNIGEVIPQFAFCRYGGGS